MVTKARFDGRRLVAAALAILNSPLPAQAAPVLWPSNSGGNDHYYELVPSILTQAEALEAAATRARPADYEPGYLATITSQAEQDFISTNFPPLETCAPFQSPCIWIGGSDLESEGTWKWVVGPEAGQTMTDAGTTNWYAGEPNDNGGTEDCAIYGWNHTTAWNDVGCSGTSQYLVEWDPEPTTCSLPSSDLVAWYSGDSTANDSSVNANHGTYHGTGTFTDDGKIGAAFALDGDGDYLSAPSTAANDPTTSGSEAAWVKFATLPSAAGHIMEIIGKGSNGRDFDLQAETDDRFRFFIAGGIQVASKTVVQPNVWYHVVGTWDSTEGLAIYVNGNLEATSATLVTREASGQPLQVGNQPFFGPRYFHGVVDEARVWNRALDDEEVAAHACSGFCGDYNGDTKITAPDALGVLRAAVNQSIYCPLWRCDTDDSTSVVAPDALRVLRFAVGQGVLLDCPLPQG